MSGRRPYANRGIPQRPTTRAKGSSVEVSRTLVIAFGSVVIAMATVCFMALQPEARPQPSALTLQAAPGVEALEAGAVVPTPTEAAPRIAAAAGPTQRQWDAHATGIVSDPDLVVLLDRTFAQVDGHLGIAVKDLGSGRGAVLNGDLELQSASLYKLPVLYTTFAAGLSMSELLPITADALSYDSGTMELGVGEALTVAEALERMVTLSDNTSAVMLASRLGGGRIISSFAALGMDTTHFSLDRMTTSALDMLRLVELMANGKAESSAASADMVHLLLRQRVNDRLPRLLPDDVQVAHKTGNLPGTVNDVGIVYGPSTTLVVAALVSDTTDEIEASTAIARAAQAAYRYFDEQPEVVNRPTIPPSPSRAIPPVWRQPRPPTPTPPAVEATDQPIEKDPTVVPEVVAASTVTAVATRPAATATVAPTEKPTPTPPPPTATTVPPSATPTAPPAPTKASTRAPATTATPSKR